MKKIIFIFLLIFSSVSAEKQKKGNAVDEIKNLSEQILSDLK